MTDGYARQLAEARLNGTEAPAPPRWLSLQEGYAFQAHAAELLGTPAGWKIGATSREAMEALGVREPVRGRVFLERMYEDGAVIDLPGELAAEPEVMFVLGRDLGPTDDPRSAVARAAFAAEIVRATRKDALEHGPGFVVADNAASLAVLVGPDLPLEALVSPAAIRATLSVEGGESTKGSADAVLGDPLIALGWLAQSTGGLSAGSVVLTGAMAAAIPVPKGSRLTLICAPFGSASGRF